MKVLVVGGGGGMGRGVVRNALTFDCVSEIVLAGIDIERAQRFAAALDDPRVRAIHLDITDTPALQAAMRATDVVLNTAGPFFRFGVPVLEAAIEAGKPYCDICDDWEPTLAMLALDERARQRGVTAVIGLGSSPGIANMLSVKAASALDRVDSIVSAWKLSGATNTDDDGFADDPPAGTAAAAVHLMHCLSEKIRVVRNGEFQDVTPLEQFSIDYPGVGPVDVWTLGHPEAVTLPRRFPALQTCYNGMLGIGRIVDDLRALANEISAGRLSVDDAAAMLMANGGSPQEKKPAQDKRPSLPGLLAYAAGSKDGRPARAGAQINRFPPGGMAGVTGGPLSLFLPLLQRGAIKGPGVFAPEEAIDADLFFQLLDELVGPEGTGLTVTVSG
jgi:saccharopine dehydrogenase-like NADP-dependent oxidoreductase